MDKELFLWIANVNKVLSMRKEKLKRTRIEFVYIFGSVLVVKKSNSC
jgi:predicted nucleotidyltransferase